MLASEDDVVKRFFQLPELVARLLSFLDVKSILNLAKAHPPTIKILKNRSKMWKGLVNKIIDSSFDPYQETWTVDELDRDIQHLNELLQMMGGPGNLLLELLHAICECHASHKYEGPYEGEVVLNCPCQISNHSVAPAGFKILEAVEGGLSSTIQKVESVAVSHLDEDLLRPLGARLRRQWDLVIEVDTNILLCGDQESARNARVLLMQSREVQLQTLFVAGYIGRKGWAALAKSLSRFPGCCKKVEVHNRQYLLGGKSEDLKSIWESLQPGQGENNGWGIWEPSTKFLVFISKEADAAGEEEERGWEVLEQIVEMSREKWLDEAGERKREAEMLS